MLLLLQQELRYRSERHENCISMIIHAPIKVSGVVYTLTIKDTGLELDRVVGTKNNEH